LYQRLTKKVINITKMGSNFQMEKQNIFGKKCFLNRGKQCNIFVSFEYLFDFQLIVR